MTEISVVIPVLDEEENITQLYSSLKEVMVEVGRRYEIIFVDDGSTDRSFAIMKNINDVDPQVKIIKFYRNFGKAASLSAGFKHCSGDIIVTLDADLQDDPKEIPKFIEEIDKGYDLVVGWRFKRQDPVTKTLPSKFFNWLTSLMTDVKIHDFNCGFKAYRRKVVEDLDLYGDLHRYIPALVHWKGYKVGEVKIKHHPRKFGKSKYGVGRLGKGFLDLITVRFLITFARRPIHFFGGIGFLSVFIGFLIAIYLAYIKFAVGYSIGDRPSLILAVLLMIIGLQFISLGLLGEMITRSSGRDEYNIKKIIK